MLKNRLLILLLIVLSSILVSFYGGPISYTLFTASLLIIPVAWLYILYVFLRFRIYQNIVSKTLHKNEKISYAFILANEDVISYNSIQVTFLSDCFTIDNIDTGRVYCLLPSESYTYNTSLTCNCMGMYNIGVNKVIIRDFFNLFSFHYSLPAKLEVNVLPRLLHLEKLSFYSREDGKTVLSPMELSDSLPDTELRSYVSGDELKRIHWKASAHAGSLLTRKLTNEPKRSVCVCTDFSAIEGNDITKLYTADHVIEATLAIIDFFFREHTPVSLCQNSRKPEYIDFTAESDIEAFYSICSKLLFMSSTPMALITDSAIKRYGQGCIYMLVIHTSDTHTLDIIRHMSGCGYELAVIYVGSDSAVSALCSNLHIAYVNLPLDKEVEEQL